MSASVSMDILAKDKSASRVLNKVGTEALGASKNLFHLSGVGKKALVGLGAAAGALAAGWGVKKIVTGSTDAFKELALSVIQLKRITGGSVQGTSQLRFAIHESGVDVTKATGALGIFAKKLGVAAGDQKKAAALTDQLGVSFRNAHGQIKPLTVLLPQLSDTFAKMPDGAGKTALAMQIFGKSGRDMLPFLNKGSEGIAELRKESDKLGLTLDQSALDKFSRYKVASREWEATLQGLRVTLGSQFLPIMTRFTKLLTNGLGPGVGALVSFVKTSPKVRAAFGAIAGKMQEFGNFLKSDVGPGIAGFITGMQDGTGAGGAFADAIHNTINVTGGLLGIVSRIPAPLAGVIVKVSLAALAFGKLQKVIASVKATQFVTAMTTMSTSAATTGTGVGALSTRMEAMKTAARGLAGVGGMLAVTDATSRSNKAMAGLEGAVGGAMAGFAATGNPIGALIGGAAGGLLGIVSATRKVGKTFTDTIPSNANFASSLDQITGAATRETRQLALADLQKRGAIATGTKLGLSQRDLVSASLGNEAALKRVNAAIDAYDAKYKSATFTTDMYGHVVQATTTNADDLRVKLGLTADQFRNQSRATRQAALATDALAKIYPKIPRNIVTKIAQQGGAETEDQITTLASKVHLKDWQIKVLLGTANLPATLADINRLKAAADAAARRRTLTFSVAGGVSGGGGGGRGTGGSSGPSHGKRLAAGRFDSGSSAASISERMRVLLTILPGIRTGHLKLSNALDKVKSSISDWQQKLTDLQSTRAGFLNTFGGTSSLSTDISEGGGFGALLAAQQLKTSRSTQLSSDISSLLSKHISKSLLMQMQNLGEAGIDQIHALNTGSAQQLAMYAQLDKAANAALSTSGLAVGNAIRGGSIDADIAKRSQNLALAKAIAKELAPHLGKAEVHIHLEGKELVYSIKAEARKKGKKASKLLDD